jgi:hypothetical protein
MGRSQTSDTFTIARTSFELLMAEQALYNNHSEPQFPFSLILPNLGWLAGYLAENEPTLDDFNPADAYIPKFLSLLDTVLVFFRARTSALHLTSHLNECRKLVKRLNAAAKQAGPKAMYHKLEIVRRGSGSFFITCVNSPRFSWNPRISQLEVGRNLDYFAAGQIYYNCRTSPDRHGLCFIEKRTMVSLFAETIPMSVLRDEHTTMKFREFNDNKEMLMNKTMESLGLPYRFKWIFEAYTDRDCLQSTTLGSRPPSAQWWAQNCPSLHRYTRVLKYCSFTSQFERHWPLIRRIYEFSSNLAHPFWYQKESLIEWGHLFALFSNVKTVLEEKAPSSEQLNYLEAELEPELQRILTLLRHYSTTVSTYYRPISTRSKSRFCKEALRSYFLLLALVKSRICSRYSRTPLVNAFIPIDPDSEAFGRAFPV